MSTPWWQTWPVKKLSPLNPLAVVRAQLVPPIVGRTKMNTATWKYEQLFWLQWHARPDLREQQLEWQKIPANVHYQVCPVDIHPDTLAGWNEPPSWKDAEQRQMELLLRRDSVQLHSLTAEQCRMIHPDTWTSENLAIQASQSEAHGRVLLERIMALNDYGFDGGFTTCIVEYARRTRALTGPCGRYLLQRAAAMPWSHRMARELLRTLEPFPDELVPCIYQWQQRGLPSSTSTMSERRNIP